MTRSPSSDLEALKDLLLWAREERIVLHEVKTGELIVTCTDLELQGSSPAKPNEDESDRTPERPRNLYQEHAKRIGLDENTIKGLAEDVEVGN